MAKTSIHFKPCNVGSVEAHNERSQEYLDGVRKSGREFYFFPDLTHLNRSYVNPGYDSYTCKEIFEKQKEAYIRKTGQKPNLENRIVTNKKTGKQRTISGWSPIREGVAPIKEDTKLEDFQPFIAWCNNHGLKVIRIDLHFDEGYEDAKKNRTFNRHAHIVVDWLDWQTAKTAKLDAATMSEAQDVIADSLGMERGEKKAESGKEHLAPAQYREQKAEETAISLEQENDRLRAENQKLKADNDILRNANTGFAAKIQDSWKYKSKAKEAEAALKAEKSRLSEEINNREGKIAKLEKVAENEKKRANNAEKDLGETSKKLLLAYSDIERLKNQNKNLMEKLKAMDVLQERAVQSLINFGKSRRTFIPDELKADINNYMAAVNPKATAEHRRLFAQALVIDCIYAVDSTELEKLEEAAHQIAADVPGQNRGMKR